MMKMIDAKIWWLFCCLFQGTFLFVYAQNEYSFEDTLTITATRIPLKTYETGRSIQVISGQELGQFPITAVDDILRYVPGVEIQSRNAFGVQSDITMRGSTFNQVLILLDGMRINDPLTGHFNNYIPISPSEIARIEVLKGPAAAMFGPDAVGGVIHILSKTFVNKDKQANQTVFETDLNYGEHNLYLGRAGLYYSKNKLKLSIGASLQQSDGEPIPPQEFIVAGDTTALDGFNNYFDLKNITASISANLGAWAVYARTAYDYRDFSARYFYTNSAFDQSVEKTTSFWNHLNVSRATANGSHQFDAAYRVGTDEFIFNPAFTGNNHETRFFNFQYNYFSLLKNDWRINTGMQTSHRAISSNDRGNHEDFHLGGYIQAAKSIAEDWQLNMSLRLDYDENYDLELLPQLNINYLQENWLWRATAGRAIRAANYTERYVSNNLPAPLTPGRNFGNPSLQAESSWSFETGFDLFRNRPIQFAVTGFTRIGSNLIDYVATSSNNIPNNEILSPDEVYFFAQNFANVNTSGIEIWTTFRQTISGIDADISSQLGYTFLNTTLDDGIESIYLSNHAKHLIQANIKMEHPQWLLAFNALYKERNSRSALAINQTLSPNYLVGHVKIGFKPTSHLMFQLQIQNIGDTQYQEILGAPMPGRWFLGGIKWNLVKGS